MGRSLLSDIRHANNDTRRLNERLSCHFAHAEGDLHEVAFLVDCGHLCENDAGRSSEGRGKSRIHQVQENSIHQQANEGLRYQQWNHLWAFIEHPQSQSHEKTGHFQLPTLSLSAQLRIRNSVSDGRHGLLSNKLSEDL